MIRHTSCITRDKLYKSDAHHVTYAMTVGDLSMHANILYKFESAGGVDTKFALIYADLLFSGFPDKDGPGAQLFIKNAKISDLINYLK